MRRHDEFRMNRRFPAGPRVEGAHAGALIEVEWTPACGEAAGAAVGPCAEKARKLAGNLVVRSGTQSEVFWCRPTP